jgi:hypothetical protein
LFFVVACSSSLLVLRRCFQSVGSIVASAVGNAKQLYRFAFSIALAVACFTRAAMHSPRPLVAARVVATVAT